MATVVPPQWQPLIQYPDSDGEPFADNTLQYDWISTLKWNAEAYFRDRYDVFVAGDNLIYAVKGDVTARAAPDVYVAFGRPKGYRGSYKVWQEDDIFPQLVVEVWSPNNREEAMHKKFLFYERHGAEEYLIVFPDFPSHLHAWQRTGDKLVSVPVGESYTSPLLGFRFDLRQGVLTVFGPDGRPVRRPDEIAADRDAAERQRDAAAQERDAAAQERDAERDRAARLAAKLRELGLDPDAV